MKWGRWLLVNAIEKGKVECGFEVRVKSGWSVRAAFFLVSWWRFYETIRSSVTVLLLCERKALRGTLIPSRTGKCPRLPETYNSSRKIYCASSCPSEATTTPGPSLLHYKTDAANSRIKKKLPTIWSSPCPRSHPQTPYKDGTSIPLGISSPRLLGPSVSKRQDKSLIERADSFHLSHWMRRFNLDHSTTVPFKQRSNATTF